MEEKKEVQQPQTPATQPQTPQTQQPTQAVKPAVTKEPLNTKVPATKEGNVPGVEGSSVPLANKDATPKKGGAGSGGSELSDIEGGSDECNQKGCGVAAGD